MQSITLQKKLLGMLVIFCGMFFSIDGSQKNGLTVSFIKPAYAVIGRPATPGSVAGVHRRVHRRSAVYYNNQYYHHHHHHNKYKYSY